MQVGCIYCQSLKKLKQKKVNHVKVTQPFGAVDFFKTEGIYKPLLSAYSNIYQRLHSKVYVKFINWIKSLPSSHNENSKNCIS